MGSIPRSGSSPGGGHGNPFQYSCLENPMDRRVWQVIVHRVSKSQTQLKQLSTRSVGKTIHLRTAAAAAAKSLQSCPTLCKPIDGSPPGSSVPGILQARILEWVAIFFSNACMHAKSLQSCLTLCDAIERSPPVSSVHRIL